MSSELHNSNQSNAKNRYISVDTETTGIRLEDGNRIIEIGCVAVENGKVTGEQFHVYMDPEREVEEGAEEVHGWKRESLLIAAEIELENHKGEKYKKVRKFRDVCQDFLEFIGDSPLVIHNAPFDMGFFDMEFERLGYGEKYLTNRTKVFDTYPYANIVHPGKRNNLDALCKRYKVDNSGRDYHGALLDAKLLAEVFVKMKTPENDEKLKNSVPESKKLSVTRPIKKTPISEALSQRQIVVSASEDEKENHRSMFDKQLDGVQPW